MAACRAAAAKAGATEAVEREELVAAVEVREAVPEARAASREAGTEAATAARAAQEVIAVGQEPQVAMVPTVAVMVAGTAEATGSEAQAEAMVVMAASAVQEMKVETAE
eukprot:4432912-Prymnesium_polylepis.2